MYNMIRFVQKGFVYSFLVIVSLLVLYPVVYVLSAAFSPGVSISSLTVIPFADGITADHFRKLFTQTPYFAWFKNTLAVAFFTSVGTVFLASMGACVFSRFSFHGKKSMLTAMLVLQIFPSFLGMVAVYVMLLRLGALDTLHGLVLVYVAGNIPYSTWLVKSYVDTVPRSLDEAARIDGAGNFHIFAKILIPVIRPIVLFLAVTSFCMPWMDFIFPKMILRSPENMTLALGLFSFVTDKKNEFTLFAAGAVPIAIPFILLFALSRNALISSFGTAAVKE